MVKIMKVRNNTTISVLGTARNEHIRKTLGKLDAPGVQLVLVVKEARASDFVGYNCDIRVFNGQVTVNNEALIETLSSIGADQIVVVTGDVYCHEPVLAALIEWEKSGRLTGYQLYMSYPEKSPLNNPTLVSAGVGPDPLATWPDPTKSIPPGYYSHERANEIYGNTFRICFEYLRNQSTSTYSDVVEFGVFKGSTARIMATLIAKYKLPVNLHLYDSFQGFPSSEHRTDKESYEIAKKNIWLPGDMSLPENIVDDIRRALGWILPLSQIKIIKGFFEETLKSSPLPTNVALVHIDCDLYISTKMVLDELLAGECFSEGAVLMFDDYNCNQSNNQMGERAALHEAFSTQSRYTLESWFSYGWHGQTFFVHGNANKP